MIANWCKRWFVLILIAGSILLINARGFAHIVTVDNILDIVADRDHATGELMVPLDAMLLWSAGLAGRTTPDKTDDPLAYAKAQGDKLVKGLNLTYGDIAMDAKVTEASVRTIDLQLSEDSTPQPIVVYKIDFTPQQKIAAPPAEISFGHTLLAVPEEFQQVDVTIMCFVHFHQVGLAGTKGEAVGPDEHVTFKCKWPIAPASAPAKSSSMAPAPANVLFFAVVAIGAIFISCA
jgi:hypothetical protein